MLHNNKESRYRKIEELRLLIETTFEGKYKRSSDYIPSNEVFLFELRYILYKNFIIRFEYNEREFKTLRIFVGNGEGTLYLGSMTTKKLIGMFNGDGRILFEDKFIGKQDILHDLKILDEELRLRLPDKFLAQFD